MAGEGRLVDDRCPNCGAPPPGVTGTCAYCGSHLRRAGGDDGGSRSGPVSVRGIRLKPFVLLDQQGLGLEVCRLLMPADWQVSGGVRWDMANIMTPGVVALQIHNPSGAEAFEVFPPLWFYWTSNPIVRGTHPVGANYFGCEMRQPLPAQAMLRDLILPRLRGGCDAVQLISEGDVPELGRLAMAASGGTASQADGRKARLRFGYRGTSFEEELYAGITYTRGSLPGTWGPVEHVYWGTDSLFSFRAAAGHLDDQADLFQAMLHSVRSNPAWLGAYAQLKTQLIQGRIRHINQIGAIGRQIAEQGSTMREENLASFEQRQAIYDRLSLDWSQTIRGVDEYYSPYEGRGVELPGGYGYAWTNDLGEYIVSDDPNLNPNIGSSQTWQPMPRRGP